MNYSPRTFDYFERLPHVYQTGTPYSHTLRLDHEITCETVQLFVRYADERLVTAQFLARGSIPTLATCAWSCEHLTGQSLDAIRALNAPCLAEALELPPLKIYSAVFIERAWHALLTALIA